MKVLLAIKEEFASKIFEGTKRYEFRKSIFKKPGVTSVVMYVTAPVGKVVGEFEIGEVLSDRPDALWGQTGLELRNHGRALEDCHLNQYRHYRN